MLCGAAFAPILRRSNAHTVSQEATTTQAKEHTTGTVASITATSPADTAEASIATAATPHKMLNSWTASKQADLSTARHSTEGTIVKANTPTTESASDVQKQTDNKQDSLRDARCKKPPVESNKKEKCPTPFLGVRQIATQSGLLLSSWAVLTLFQPGGHPVLLFVAIVLSRLHLGWLLCCMFRMVLSSCRYGS